MAPGPQDLCARAQADGPVGVRISVSPVPQCHSTPRTASAEGWCWRMQTQITNTHLLPSSSPTDSIWEPGPLHPTGSAHTFRGLALLTATQGGAVLTPAP